MSRDGLWRVVVVANDIIVGLLAQLDESCTIHMMRRGALESHHGRSCRNRPRVRLASVCVKSGLFGAWMQCHMVPFPSQCSVNRRHRAAALVRRLKLVALADCSTSCVFVNLRTDPATWITLFSHVVLRKCWSSPCTNECIYALEFSLHT